MAKKKKQSEPINYDAIEKLGGFGNPNGLCIILDKPSPAQYKNNVPLVGMEKDLIETLLKAVDFDLDQIYWIFAIPYVYKAKLSQDMIQYNHWRLMKQLEKANPSKILCMGPLAFSVLYNTERTQDISDWRGKGMYTYVNGKQVYTVSTIPGYYAVANDGEFRELEDDIIKLAEHDKPMKLPLANIYIPDDIIEFKRYLHQFKQYDIISCDLETSGYDPINGSILAIGFGHFDTNSENDQLKGNAFIVPKELIYNKEVKECLKRWLFSKNHKFVFHNAKFDLKFLRTYFDCYIDDINIDDTILLNYVLDERPIGGESGRGKSQHGLKTLARVYYDADDYHFDFDEFSSLPENERNYTDLYQYLSLDLIYTGALFYDLMYKIGDEFGNMPWFYPNLLIPGSKALVEMELRGTLLDIGYLKTLQSQLEKLIEETLLDMKVLVLAFSGDPAFASKFNPNSWQQIAKMLYKILGAPQLNGNHTDEKTLVKIRQRVEASNLTDFMDTLLKYREYGKLLSTYVLLWQKRVDKNNRFHPDFKINGTITGRLSSDMQQTPRPTDEFNLRKAFVSTPGYLFMNADYSQLEMRVAGMLSGDPILTEIYRENRDLHYETASAVLKKPVSEITKKERQRYKPVGFGILYGIGAQGLAEHKDMIQYKYTVKDAQKMIDGFLDRFSVLKEWIANTKKQIHEKHYVETLTGRKRRFPFIHNGNREDIYRQAVNMPIQGTATDFGLWSLIKLNVDLRQYDSYLVVPVHDSLMIEVKEEYINEVRQLVKDTMENTTISTNGIPLVVDIDYAKSWS